MPPDPLSQPSGERKPPRQEIQARDVVVGEYLDWCDYRVRVMAVEQQRLRKDGRSSNRPCTILTVADPLGGEDRHLHYYATEIVSVSDA